jgi:PGF-pre-PGF domain-containing protein
VSNLVTSGLESQREAATNIFSELATSQDQADQETVTNIGTAAASNPSNAAEITELFNDVTSNPEALANIGLAHQVVVKGNTPEVGQKNWRTTGSPAPIETILTRFSDAIEGAHIAVVDVETLPAGVPSLPADLTVNSMFTLTPENFELEDVVTNHVTFFVEKSWLEENGIHPWAIQFNRYDPDLNTWVPLIGKLDREDDDRIFYTVAPPGFSLWAITGATEVPAIRFEENNIQISPSPAEAGKEVQVQVQVSNLTDDSLEYNAVLWVDGDVETSLNVIIGANASEIVTLTVELDEGEHAVRIGKQLGALTVAAAAAPAAPAATTVPAATPVSAPTVAAPQPTAVPEIVDDDDDGFQLGLIIGIIVVVLVTLGIGGFLYLRRREGNSDF